MSSKHLNLSTIVDKNKIESDKAFLILFAVEIRNTAGNLVETLRFCKNSSNVTFMGNVYQAANFNLNIDIEQGKEPSVRLSAQDQTRTLASYIDAYDGLIKQTVKLLVVHEDQLDGPPEMEEDFLITECDVEDYIVSIGLGTESAIAQRFPIHRQFKDRCAWKYKGIRCKYTGALPTCDFTRTGANGCIAHNNEANFGGFPGLNDLF